jgi:hypothetical protein
MTSILPVLNAIRDTPGCIVHPPTGLPPIRDEHILPEDVREFYMSCGGVDLFPDAPFSVTIVPPDKVVLANPVIIGNWEEDKLRANSADDISWSWYIIAESSNSQYITIDLSPERLGYCYDSFWELHPGDSAIIATSFTDLLMHLLANRGQHWYWLEPGFQTLGRPYDL